MRGTHRGRYRGSIEEWDHPRVCGEHLVRPAPHVLNLGSSPRMRGTPVYGKQDALQTGIIPAYAGNTQHPMTRVLEAWDHPRVCGEHFRMPLRFGSVPGSSPRMRGTLRLTIFSEEIDGIIPAYAGNTFRRLVSMILNRDHPRVCGEHVANTSRGIFRSGSSPRMRGTHVRGGCDETFSGIIPAYAGNTGAQHLSFPFDRDHPRVCGEHFTIRFVTTAVTGSSPRMRGTLRFGLQRGQVRGIIPAYAGNTQIEDR